MITYRSPSEQRRNEESFVRNDVTHGHTILHQEHSSPAAVRANLIETWGAYAIQVTLPGVRLDSLKIEVAARRLTVDGTFDIPIVESGAFVWRGIPTGEFHQDFELPGEVNPDRGTARFDRGILTIELPKVAHLKSSTIPVREIRYER